MFPGVVVGRTLSGPVQHPNRQLLPRKIFAPVAKSFAEQARAVTRSVGLGCDPREVSLLRLRRATYRGPSSRFMVIVVQNGVGM